MKHGTCPKCNSTAVMANVYVNDLSHGGDHPLRVKIEEPKPADSGFLWMPLIALGEVRAWICSACGYTELYTDNLAELYKLYKMNP